jgi:hypothetical protein
MEQGLLLLFWGNIFGDDVIGATLRLYRIYDARGG